MNCKRIVHILLVGIVGLALQSCGVMRFPNHPRYHAGEASPTDYRPDGTLLECEYNCSVKGPAHRRMIVYLPDGYADSGMRYPVIYLLHGARGYETSWIRKGGVLQLADSLYRNGLARPCILVMPNMNQYNDDADCDGSRYKDIFESLFEIDGAVESAFMDDVVAYVDSAFRTLPYKEGRGIAGLSIGGLQSMYISANNPQSFGYVGLLSPMCGTLYKSSDYRWFYKDLLEKHKRQFAPGSEPAVYNIYIGRGDVVYPQVKLFNRYMDKHSFPHGYTATKGNHDWPYWRAYFVDFMKQIL